MVVASGWLFVCSGGGTGLVPRSFLRPTAAADASISRDLPAQQPASAVAPLPSGSESRCGGGGEGGGGEGEGAAVGGLSEVEVGTLLQLELACRGCASDLSCLPRCPRTWLWASWPRPRGCVVVSRGHAMKVSR